MLPVRHARHDDRLEVLEDRLDGFGPVGRGRGQLGLDLTGADLRADRQLLDGAIEIGHPVDEGVRVATEGFSVDRGRRLRRIARRVVGHGPGLLPW